MSRDHRGELTTIATSSDADSKFADALTKMAMIGDEWQQDAALSLAQEAYRGWTGPDGLDLSDKLPGGGYINTRIVDRVVIEEEVGDHPFTNKLTGLQYNTQQITTAPISSHRAVRALNPQEDVLDHEGKITPRILQSMEILYIFIQ